MAITLVTPGTPIASSSAPSGGPPPATDAPAGMSFGDLLSFQLNSLPLTAQAAGTGHDDTDEATASTATVDTGTFLAGMLAVSPETTPTAKISLAGTAITAQQNQSSILTNSSSSQADSQLDNLSANLLSPLSASAEQTSSLTGKTTPAAILAASANQPGETASADFAATLAAQATNQSNASRGQEASIRTDVDTPLHDPRWAQGFGERIVWLAKNDQQSAQININPPQLGPVQINIKLNGDQATATFVSPHAEVRQAIEDAMPRLREVLAGAGIDLGQANVGAQLAQQDRGNHASTPDSSRFSGDKAILREDAGRTGELPAMTGRSGRGLVDLFA